MPQAVAQRLQDEFGLTSPRLWPHRDRRAQPRQPARCAPSCSAWASRSSASTRASWIRSRCAELPPGETGEIVTTGRWCSRATGSHPEATEAAFVTLPGDSERPAVLPHRRPRPHGRGRLLLPHRPPQAHDQRERLQGLAGRGGGAAVQAPGGAEACIIAARDEYRGETVKGGGAARRGAGKTAAEDILAWAREHMAACQRRPRSSSSSTACPSRARAR